MIWILCILFICLESLTHWYFIEVRHEDVTPDGKFTFRHVLVMSARFIVFVLLSAIFKHPDQISYFCFMLGALSSHLLIFGPLLNAMRGEKIHYLGKGFTDNLFALIPYGRQKRGFFARSFFLFIITVSSIYTYYNTYLL